MIAILAIRQKDLKSPEFNKKDGKILNIILVKTENTALQQKVVLIQDLNISEKNLLNSLLKIRKIKAKNACFKLEK